MGPPCLSALSPYSESVRLLLLALLVSACGDGAASLSVPDITDPSCGYVEREALEAREGTCILLVPGEGAETRFLSERDNSCRGAPCLLLRPGERGVVIGPATAPYADYDLTIGDCGMLPACPVDSR